MPWAWRESMLIKAMNSIHLALQYFHVTLYSPKLSKRWWILIFCCVFLRPRVRRRLEMKANERVYTKIVFAHFSIWVHTIQEDVEEYCNGCGTNHVSCHSHSIHCSCSIWSTGMIHDVDVIALTLALVLSFELGMAKAVTTEIATAIAWAALLTVAIAIRSFHHVALVLDHSGRSHHLAFYQAPQQSL